VASAAFHALEIALGEVEHLLAVLPGQGPLRGRLARARVVGRASVVLLASHFERFFYALNEEAISFLNARNVPSNEIPEPMRLLQCANIIDRLSETQWQNRAAQLAAFAGDDARLWIDGETGILKHDALLTWMKSPKPTDLLRYFSYWGINDVFTAVTRKRATRARMFLLVSELVDKRNDIAHGDATAQATKLDVQRYAGTVRTFCARVDRLLSVWIERRFRNGRPW